MTSDMTFASKSVTRHLARGVVGFGLLIGSMALILTIGYTSLLLALLGVLALRGCPTCWAIGLAQTIGAVWSDPASTVAANSPSPSRHPRQNVPDSSVSRCPRASPWQRQTSSTSQPPWYSCTWWATPADAPEAGQRHRAHVTGHRVQWNAQPSGDPAQ